MPTSDHTRPESARPESARPESARMGPNAIIQTVHALREQLGEAEANALLVQHAHAHLVDALPSEMIDEAAFHTLVQMLVVQMGSAPTGHILHDAGQRTAHYLLLHRIPRFFQRLVGWLPRRAGLWLLLTAIGKHAWTFAGSGQFRFVVQQQPTIYLTIQHPTVQPVAHFYGGTFGVLVQTLIDPQTTVHIGTNQHNQQLDCIYTLAFEQRATA
ncbi:MAG: bacteriochlorophyll 4-vinyl reductase [Blastochloris sp.]|nr:bacteriochlorophyll 4-vinyl reductase [Blastochloris sp.]